MKVKKVIDGKEVEIELTPDDIKAMKLQSETALLENDELFNEAAEMRGISLKNGGKVASRELNKLERLITQQQSEIESLKGLVEKVSGDKKASDEQIQNYLAEQKKKEVESLLSDAIAKGRITPEKKEAWAKRFEKDHDLTKEALMELPENKSLQSGQSGQGSNGTGTSAQTNNAPTGNKILDSIRSMNANAAININ